MVRPWRRFLAWSAAVLASSASPVVRHPVPTDRCVCPGVSVGQMLASRGTAVE
jgi:hypothetical protein